MENRSRKKMHLDRFNYHAGNHVYFVTICTADKMPFLKDSRVAEIIVDELEIRRGKEEIILFCYCIMPDHVHIMISLSQGHNKTLIDWVSFFKRFTARRVKASHGIAPLWQKNFYDHVVRSDEALINVVEYIVNNPVRKGMVRDWKEYPYSRMVDPLPV